jgi:hypothetical protein
MKLAPDYAESLLAWSKNELNWSPLPAQIPMIDLQHGALGFVRQSGRTEVACVRILFSTTNAELKSRFVALVVTKSAMRSADVMQRLNGMIDRSPSLRSKVLSRSRDQIKFANGALIKSTYFGRGMVDSLRGLRVSLSYAENTDSMSLEERQMLWAVSESFLDSPD